jgi:hypothetical protein
VNGRNAIRWAEKFELDIRYIKTVSFSLDMRIILTTIKNSFLKREGIMHDGDVTMPLFLGVGEKDIRNV